MMTNQNNDRIVPMRLQKFLARAGAASRRGSENLMTAGRVKVNGIVVTELGSKVDPRVDTVELDGIPVLLDNEPVTLMLHKPAGFITTMTDPFKRRCVAELVPLDMYPGLYPIGRLDSDTTGLLLFSTDGELGNKLLHPSRHVKKTYQVWVEGVPTKVQLEQLEKGIELEDGLTAPAEVALVQEERGRSLFELSIYEGRKRQVKRMFEAIGHPVLALHRISFGPLSLGELQLGSWRILDSEEIEKLHQSIA